MRRPVVALLFLSLLLAIPREAHAYVGPGAGMTLIGSFLGLLATIACALGAILLWPIRRALRRRRRRREDAQPTARRKGERA
jgi:nitrate reductase gamma subunit